MRDKFVPLYLPKSDYDQLREVAEAEDRDPLQQARWMLRCALASANDHPFEEASMPQYINKKAGRNREKTARALHSYQPGNVALGTTTAVHAAVSDTGAQQVITTAITSPDVPRTIIATPGGTTANVTAVSCIIAGTDINGAALTETLPAFSAGAATAKTSVNAFATVTSITQPAIGASVTVSYGTTAQLGLPFNITRNTVRAAYLNGALEATAPTVTVHATDASKTLVQLNSALNASAVIIDYYES